MGSPAWIRWRGSVVLPLGLALLLVLGLATSGHAGKGAVLPGKPPISILPLGDSITLGVSNGLPGGQTPGGYRSPLDSMLSDEQIPHTFLGTSTANSSPTLMLRDEVHHEGHPGYRVSQVTTD